jgi:uridine kinase
MTRSQLLKELAAQLMAIKRPHPIRVAIDGVDAAGKTSLANELGPPLQEQKRLVIRASIDGFHNPREIRYKRGPNSPAGYYYDSFDYKAIKSLLLEPLGPHGNLQYQTAIFNFRTESSVNSSTHQAHPKAILLFDGVFLLRPELDNSWDVRIFVDVDFAVSVERATHRDQKLFGSAEAVETRYRQRYVPGQQIYLQRCQPKKRADIVVSNNDPTNPTMSIRHKNLHQN